MPEKSPTESPPPTTRDPRPLEPVLEHIRRALVGLEFGQISLIVQDGVVVQVERVERKRFRRGER
jgi:hypothetical protein